MEKQSDKTASEAIKYRYKKTLSEFEIQLRYLKPKDGWQPNRYNQFIENVEESIETLTSICSELKKDVENKSQVTRTKRLLMDYQILQEKYY